MGRRRSRADGDRHRHRQLAELVGRRQRASAARPVQVDGARRAVEHATSADRVWLVTIDGRVRGGSASSLRDEIDRLEADRRCRRSRARARRARRPSCARRDSTRDRSRSSPTASAPSGSTLRPIADAQIAALRAARSRRRSNRAVTLAEARPVRWTPRGAVATRFLSRDSTTYRITLNGRTFARGTAAPNEEVIVRASPPERGWVAGTVELEPDELAGRQRSPFRGLDRRRARRRACRRAPGRS